MKVLVQLYAYKKQKKDSFDASYIRNFAPRRLDNFDFIPSIGSSGGMLILWNSSIFTGVVLEKKHFALTISFTLVHNREVWKLSSVYGPCTETKAYLLSGLKICKLGRMITR